MDSVTEVVVSPDCLKLLADGKWVVSRFAEIATWPRPQGLLRLLAGLGLRPAWLPVADRDWFHPPPVRYFSFYTEPRLVIYMPDEDGVPYEHTCFRRVQEVLRSGGFSTFDLG